MFLGVLLGFISATIQSASYVASRGFLGKHKSPFLLTLYSQFFMLWVCVGLFCYVVTRVDIPWSFGFCLLAFSCAMLFLCGQAGFFMAMRDIEPSRASALLGLKMVALAIFTSMLGDTHNLWQWVAVLLCSAGAVGMNFSGGKMPLRGCLWMLFSIVGYSLCDMACAKMVHSISGDNIIIRSLTVVSLNYIHVGVLAFLLFTKVKFEPKKFIDAVPFSILWIVASVGLISCYGLLGALYGNIIQSSRGIMSIIFGIIVLQLGYNQLEPRVSRRVWIKRFIMAGVMVGAMIIYAYA